MFYLIIFLLVIYFIVCIIASPFVFWFAYKDNYYTSEKFKNLKAKVYSYINECNELNKHILELMQTPIGFNHSENGLSYFADNSVYNYKRPELKRISFAPNVYNCSRTVCDNARKEPFKYICKYFYIKPNEENLQIWENALNNYISAENGKIALQNKRNVLMRNMEKEIPYLIILLNKEEFEKRLGFETVDLSQIYFPQYVFNYVSSGGYASEICVITMDIQNINHFITYLSQIISFRKSVQGQRALMTSRLRNEILQRDNYTCRSCGNSSMNEPNLLLEVDHIWPLSKGGLTSYNNLQTLCWKCNRSKGNKLQ